MTESIKEKRLDNPLPVDACLSCLGSGEVSSERGVVTCPDCDGVGKIKSLYLRNEQRIRTVERRAARLSGEAKQDHDWLVAELRRHRDVLYKHMSAAQDLADKDGSDPEKLLYRLWFDANMLLGVYDAEDAGTTK
jgi:hypothetical protein